MSGVAPPLQSQPAPLTKGTTASGTATEDAEESPEDWPDITTAAAAARAAMRPEILPNVNRLAGLADRLGEPERIQTPLVITGDGGYGKSVLLGQLYDLLAASGPTIILPCGRVPATADLTGVAALDQAFGNAVCDSRTAPQLTDVIARAEGRPRLLVDTLDLVVREENADDLAFLLRKLSEQTDLILTCRDREWRDYLEADRDFAASVYVMPSLTARDIVVWAGAYATAEGLNDADKAAFLASLDTGPRVREVLATPLRLAMACKIYADQGGIPEDLTATELYEQYWARRVAVDRYGRRTGRARAQEATADALAAEIWEMSATRFVEYVPMDQHASQPLGDLVSDGVVAVATGRYGFFHQTYAEFAVARRLARAGTEADLQRLSDGLQAFSLAYWPIAKHLLMLSTSPDRYNRLAECVPLDTTEGLRTQVAGAFNRKAPALVADVLARVSRGSLITGVRVLESSPDECLKVSLAAVFRCLHEAAASDLPKVTATAAALASRSGRVAMRQVVAMIVERADELGHDPTSSVLSRLIQQMESGEQLLAEFVDIYGTLPEAAQASVIERLAGGALDPDLDCALILRALRTPLPLGAVDDATQLLYRTWSDDRLHTDQGWATWSDMFEADLPQRWDACQVRILARLCADGTVPTVEVLDKAFSPHDIARDGYTNTVRYLADSNPDAVLTHLRGIDGELSRSEVGTLCSVLNHMAEKVPDPDRPALAALLERHLHLSDRRVWPTIIKLCDTNLDMLRARSLEVAERSDDVVRRSAFDTFLNVLDSSAIAEIADELRELLPEKNPKDGERRARLEGTLTPYSEPAREWVERQITEGKSAPMASTAARATIAALRKWSAEDLQATGLPWLTRLLRSPWPNTVRLVADGLRNAGAVLLDVDQANDVFRRLEESLTDLDDAQVLAALLDLLVAAEHAVGLAADVVRRLLTAYRDATATALASDAPARTVDRLPAVFGQYARTITAIAIRHLTVADLSDEIRHMCTSIDVGRIANNARRPLTSVLHAAVKRYPALLPELEQLWPDAYDSNKRAIAGAITNFEAGTMGMRSLALARRPDCPPEVADFIHAKFPH